MIRTARPSDAAALAELHVASWQRAYRRDFPEQFLSRLDVDARAVRFEKEIRSGTPILISETDGQVVGFCMIGEADDKGWGEILSIYVHPREWGSGHGHELIRAAEDELRDRGFEQALLWVLNTNTRARTFYERQGWELGKPVRIEEIAGVQVTEVRYEKSLGDALPPR